MPGWKVGKFLRAEGGVKPCAGPVEKLLLWQRVKRLVNVKHIIYSDFFKAYCNLIVDSLVSDDMSEWMIAHRY